MKNTFKLKGKILFDPPNITSKQIRQDEWKKVACVLFDGDVCDYYRWFIKKRYNLPLMGPIRGPHITFINDSHNDLGKQGLAMWDRVKKYWNNKPIVIELSVDVRSDGINWWLVVPEESRGELHKIRNSLGLGRPYFGLHMTVGTAVDCVDEDDTPIPNIIKAKRMNVEHSKYIVDLLTKKLIE